MTAKSLPRCRGSQQRGRQFIYVWSGKDACGLQEQHQHHNRGNVADHDPVDLFAGEAGTALLHLLHHIVRADHPSDQDGGQQGDQGHHHAVADIVHDVQQLAGGAVGQLHLKVEDAVTQGDHCGGSQIYAREHQHGLFAVGVQDLHAVGYNGLQHRDAAGKGGKDGGYKEQHAHHHTGGTHGVKDLGQRDEHQAGACAHALHAGKDIYSRDDHGAGQQGHAGVKELDLVDGTVQVDIRFDVGTIGDHDAHGNAEREEKLAHGVQQDLQKAGDRKPLEMGGQVVDKAFHTGAHLAGGIGVAQGQGVTGDHDHQHQQHRHHVPGHPLNAILHAVVNDEGGDPHEQQGKHHRRYRRGDKAGKIVVLGGGSGLTSQVGHCIFRDPSANDRIVGHDEHRHQKGQDAQKTPPGVHLRIGADGALFCAAANGDVRGQQGEAEGQHQCQVHQQKQSAAVLGCQVGETPQIAHAYRTACGRQHKADLAGKMIRLLFHIHTNSSYRNIVQVPAKGLQR